MLAARLDRLDVTLSQAEALRVVQEGREMSVKQLGERLICEGGNPSRLVATLVRKQLVETTLDGHDRRALLISLSEKGQRLVEQIKSEERVFYTEVNKKLNESHNLESQLEAFLRDTRSARALELRGMWE